MIGIAIISKRDFDNATYDLSVARLCIVRASLKRDLRLNYQLQQLSFLFYLPLSSAYVDKNFIGLSARKKIKGGGGGG